MKNKIITLFVLLLTSLLCTACSSDHSDNTQGTSSTSININEEVEKNLYITLDKQFSNNLYYPKMEVQISEYPYEKDKNENGEILAKKYLWLDNNALVKQKEYIDENVALNNNQSWTAGDRVFTISPDSVSLNNDRDMYDNLSTFYEDGISPDSVFPADMGEWFSKQELNFMSSGEAQKLCESFLGDVAFQYQSENADWYALDTNSLIRRNQEYIMKQYPDMLSLSTAQEAYVFYFEGGVEQYELDRTLCNTYALFHNNRKRYSLCLCRF